jgi:hypothetical protein
VKARAKVKAITAWAVVCASGAQAQRYKTEAAARNGARLADSVQFCSPHRVVKLVPESKGRGKRGGAK